tara:strand:- start:2365 stop:2859 length:495 start_codon:yes stop_codon:yes gene_type:complete
MIYAEKIAGAWVEKTPKTFRSERNSSIPMVGLADAGLFEIVTDAEPTITGEQVAERGSLVGRNGRPVIGWTVRDKTAAELTVELNNKRQAMSCSKMQGILTLGETAWGEVLTYRDTASWAEQMAIDSAQDWNRTSENIAFFGYLLNYTDAQMDAMFTAAAQVTA